MPTASSATSMSLEVVCRLVAIQAALLTAAAHLLWTLPRLSGSLLLDPVADVRPFLFVPAALLLLAVAVALFRGYRYRRLSALGGGTLGSLFVGFLLWTGTDAPAALAAEPLALVAAAAELIGVVAFAGLYFLHHPERFGLAAAGDSVDSSAGASADGSADSSAGATGDSPSGASTGGSTDEEDR